MGNTEPICHYDEQPGFNLQSVHGFSLLQRKKPRRGQSSAGSSVILSAGKPAANATSTTLHEGMAKDGASLSEASTAVGCSLKCDRGNARGKGGLHGNCIDRWVRLLSSAWRARKSHNAAI
eukprot:410265-Karenia_brevis.AAC.1